RCFLWDMRSVGGQSSRRRWIEVAEVTKVKCHGDVDYGSGVVASFEGFRELEKVVEGGDNGSDDG
ncbi:hypothetical protein PIB30_090143, partial [Stylosanthes scabra]|nr:hypothetical protein [Stylosanthes scabra]